MENLLSPQVTISILNDQFSISMANNDHCKIPFKIISNYTTGANIIDSSMLNVNTQPFILATQNVSDNERSLFSLKLTH